MRMSNATEKPWTYPFPKEDWEQTPASVRAYILSVEQQLHKLEERTNRNSTNSSQPPSADSPYVKPVSSAKKTPGKPGGKKGHKGSRQQLLTPTAVKPLYPEKCSCGSNKFLNTNFSTPRSITLTSTWNFPK